MKNRGLHRFAVLVAACTVTLVFAGGLVTSTGSGLSVPDWPLSFGQFFPRMQGGVVYEHGHRMLATGVGFLTVLLAIWIWRRDARAMVRILGALAVLTVIGQGILGGITVLYQLPVPVSVGHAGLAQIFLCLTIAIALVTSDEWRRDRPFLHDSGSPSIRFLAPASTIAIFGQILLGAWMRHTGSGLAIPDFPLNFGSFIPPHFSQAIAINFAHRTGAWVVTILVIWLGASVLARFGSEAPLRVPAVLLLGTVTVQMLLGAGTVWSGRAVLLTTLHVVTGALTLSVSLILTLNTLRRVAPRDVPTWSVQAGKALK